MFYKCLIWGSRDVTFFYRPPNTSDAYFYKIERMKVSYFSSDLNLIYVYLTCGFSVKVQKESHKVVAKLLSAQPVHTREYVTMPFTHKKPGVMEPQYEQEHHMCTQCYTVIFWLTIFPSARLWKWLKCFCKTLWYPTENDLWPFRCKNAFTSCLNPLRHLCEILQ